MKNTFKRTFQPLKIAIKKALGIRKKRKGQIFDSSGFIQDSREKITRYILFLPLFAKIRTLTNISEFSNCHQIVGGGDCYKPKSTLYTIKTTYKILGIPLFFKSKTTLTSKQQSNYFGKSPLKFKLQNTPDDFYLAFWGGWNIGEYVSKNPNIAQEIKTLIKGLSLKNQIFVLRQIAREKHAYETNSWRVDNLTQEERDELTKIYTEFYPNIFKLAENLYSYDGYFFPTNFCEISVMWHKHSLHILEPQTLERMRSKDFIDVGACIGDSAVLFEREFCDKNIYTFEPTRENF